MEEDNRNGHLLPGDCLYTVPAVVNFSHALSANAQSFPRMLWWCYRASVIGAERLGFRSTLTTYSAGPAQHMTARVALSHLISDLISIRTGLGIRLCPGCSRGHHEGIALGRHRPTV